MYCLKMIRSGAYYAAVLAIVVSFTGTLFAAPVRNITPNINRPHITGTAQVLRNGVYIPLTRDMELMEGDRIVTSGANVVIQFSDGTSIRLQNNANVVLTQLGGPVVVVVNSGTVSAVNAGTSFSMINGVTGQGYIVNAPGQGLTVNANGSSTTINGLMARGPARGPIGGLPLTTSNYPNLPGDMPTERPSSPI